MNDSLLWKTAADGIVIQKYKTIPCQNWQQLKEYRYIILQLCYIEVEWYTQVSWMWYSNYEHNAAQAPEIQLAGSNVKYAHMQRNITII